MLAVDPVLEVADGRLGPWGCCTESNVGVESRCFALCVQ